METSPILKIQVILGSIRQGRFGDKPAKWIFDLAKKKKGLMSELVDLRDYALPFYDEKISPSRLKGKYPNPAVQRWANKVKEADGYIIVTPEYNHGYPAVLKNALDYIYDEWNNKPVGFISYGSVGGARVVEQLRQVVVELQMAPIRSSIHIPPTVYMAVVKPPETEEEDDGANPFDALNDHATAFLDQLIWWARALKKAREGEK